MNACKKTSLLFLFILLHEIVLLALPEGTVSVQGGGSVDVTGKNMIVEAPNGSIFEHQSFNLAVDESVQFNQPTTQSRVLNRITTAAPSMIDGRIFANGELYLVNPAGIIFGKGAVIEAARLHAIAGVLSNTDFIGGSDAFTALDAGVENEGIINAGHITLAGSKVANAGTLNASAGKVVLSAAGSMSMTSKDGFLIVSVSPDSIAPIGAATDLIGQTLLNSGVVRSKEAYLSGNTITNTGTIESKKAFFSDFSSVSAQNGTFSASEISVLGSSVNQPGQDPSGLPDAIINSSGNKISTIRATGAFDRMSVSSSLSVSVAEVATSLSLGFLSIGQADFRSTGGDLSVGVTFSPVFSHQSPSLLLAAKGDLNFKDPIRNPSNSYQLLLYGKNLNESTFSTIENPPANLYSLDARSLSVDDLNIGLGADSVFKLSTDNPSTSAFSMANGQPLEIAQVSTPALNDSAAQMILPPNSQPTLLPTGAHPSSPSGLPSINPILNSSPYLPNATGPLSLDQIKIAMANGLFSKYSYFLNSASPEDIRLPLSSTAQVYSSVFGDTYALTKSPFPPPVQDSMSMGYFNSDSNSTVLLEEIPDSEEDEKKSSAVPFSPISMPVLSPDASIILQKALEPAVESKLQNFLGR